MNAPVSMISASKEDTELAHITFNNVITAASFGSFAFTSNPSGVFSDTIVQVDADTIEVDFSGDISGDTSVTYNGSVANTVFPATVNYT